jgi:hypothetical protein
MTLRFYLSSTFRDLQKERELIAEYLVKDEHLPIQTVIASADPVLDQCLRDVEGCDVMILLVAASYGTIVPGRDGVRRSITHHEFLHAEDKRMPILVFELGYLDPPEALTEEQQRGLNTLKRDMTAMKRIPARVPIQMRLLGDVLTAVHKFLRDKQGAPLNASANDGAFRLPLPSQGAAPVAAAPARQAAPHEGRAMFVQIQLQDRADRFHLIPEVFLPGGDGGWQACPQADPEPRDAVAPGGLAKSLDDLCKEAQRRLPSGQAEGIQQVVIELLLPTEVLADCLSQPRQAIHLGQTLAHLRQLHLPCCLRSLERAVSRQQQPVWANQLRSRWNLAAESPSGLLACRGWPDAPTDEASEANALGSFKSGLARPAFGALVALCACPDDREHTGALLQALLDAPLPVLLLWGRDGVEEDGADAARRWVRAHTLLQRPLPPLPEEALDPPAAGCSPLHPITVPPEPWSKPWCSRAVAVSRQELVQTNKDWVHQAVLLLDSPERWPARLSPPPARSRPKARLRLRHHPTP